MQQTRRAKPLLKAMPVAKSNNGEHLEALVDLLAMLAEDDVEHYKKNKKMRKHANALLRATGDIQRASSSLDDIIAVHNALQSVRPSDPPPITGRDLTFIESIDRFQNKRLSSAAYNPNGRDLLFEVIDSAFMMGTLSRGTNFKKALSKILAEPANAATRKASEKKLEILRALVKEIVRGDPRLEGRSADEIANAIYAALDKKLPQEIPELLKSTRPQNRGQLTKANSIAKLIRPLLPQSKSSKK